VPKPGKTIAVVGAGPRGLAVLERLCANRPAGLRVDIHVVDPYPPGPGRVWRTDQPAELLMNTITSQVSQYTDHSVPCAGPVVPGPSLHDWLRGPESAGIAGVADARLLGPDDYPGRAVCGHYMSWVYAQLRAADAVRFIEHRHEATALRDGPGGQVLTLADGTEIGGLDAVVLALGHTGTAPSAQESAFADFAARSGLGYHPPGNPADARLDDVEPGEAVGLRGLGLVFFDFLSLLTEGRGGKFVPSESGLRYLPSGEEPLLYAGCRRGVPHHARGENQKGAAGRHLPRRLDPECIARLRRGPAVDFRREIWPLVQDEVESTYYHALVRRASGEDAAAIFLERYLHTGPAGRAAALREARVDPADLWSWERLENPCGDRAFAAPEEFTAWLVEHLRADVHHARAGNVDDPLKAALDVLRDLRNEIRQVVDHGGVRGASYRDDLVRWYNPLNAHLSIGPPASRVEEMLALVEAGVLQILGPGTTATTAENPARFLIGATGVQGSTVPVTTLIEARISDIDLRRTTSPLLRHLLDTAQCRTHSVPDPLRPYESGGLDVTGRPYRLLDAAGRPHPTRFAYGVPTESVHWATAAGIRPGVGSVTLEDADAIARAALAVG
jgi:hypothetical protein